MFQGMNENRRYRGMEKPKMSSVLVRQTRYQGRYVAMVSLADSRVVASDKDPVRAIVKAEGKGHPNAVIAFIDSPETARMHYAHS